MSGVKPSLLTIRPVDPLSTPFPASPLKVKSENKKYKE